MKSKLQNRLESGLSAITAEIMPPRGGDTKSALSKAFKLSGLVHGFNCCSLPDDEPSENS